MKICLFDIDGTLVQTGGAGKAAVEAALAGEFGVEQGASNVPFSGRTDRAIVRDLFLLHGIDDTRTTWDQFRTAYLQHLPAELASRSGSVLPGILALLQTFAPRPDVLSGLLTGNIAAGAKAKLTYYQLNHFFTFGGFGDHHFDRADVAREALNAARAEAEDNVPPEDVWVIGDTPWDVRCARAIGANVVAVCTGSHPPRELAAEGPDILLTDLADPAPVIDAIAG
ncbi:MAG: HAD hydrolase-like protein [Planctomycetales bacterium]|nr:HAD hydrolase-like protein [Planctomycetales bacterium]